MRLLNFFNNASIRSKLMFIIGMTAFLTLFVATSAITVNEHVTRKNETQQELSSLADIISWTSSAALVFMDIKTAGDTLSVLKTRPNIAAAFLYDSNDRIFAQYLSHYQDDNTLLPQGAMQFLNSSRQTGQQRQGLFEWWQTVTEMISGKRQPSGLQNTFFYDKHDQLHLLHPIFAEGEIIGVLHLIDDQSRLQAFLNKFYSIITVIFLLTLTSILLLSTHLQRIFSQPLLKLMQSMQTVSSQKNYSIRVPKVSNDEFGRLVDVYNAMLGEIQQRDDMLDKHRENLELQVKERTAELSKNNAALEQAVLEALAAKEEAEAATRAKSQFLANMSHEIRTPMNAVLGMTDFLFESKLNEDQRHSIEIVQQSSRLLLTVINDILDFSKIESGKLEFDCQPFNVHDFIHDNFALLENQAKTKGLIYRLDMADIPVMLEGDTVRLGQVLMNLLSNAVKFTATGEIVLNVSSQAVESGKIRLYCEVSDTGIGVDVDKEKQIFDAFSQADNSMTRAFGGTGLGLTIARQIVQLMKGEIGVESNPGIGSTFWFWVDLNLSDVEPSKLAVRSHCRFNANILVVEDYPANQLLAKRLLEGFGCRVNIANHGLEAIEALTQQAYDLVFMDCQMPVMDGYQASRKIRNMKTVAPTGRPIPIIALTAHALAGDKTKCLAAGMDEWVTKPFSRQDLNETLQKWLPAELILELPKQASSLSPAHHADAAAAIDINFLTQNFDFADADDLAFIEQLNQAFQQNAEQCFSGLQQGLSRKDAEQIRKLAHGLKSISANVGALQLSKYCASLEQAGQQNQLQLATALLKDITLEYSKAVAELNRICTEKKIN